MATLPKSKISPISGSDEGSGLREKRSTSWQNGIKNGLIKSTVDQVLDQIATPIAALITPKLHELHPQLELADGAVKASVEFGVLMLLAELLKHGHPLLAKMPGLKMDAEKAQKKCLALAEWTQNYAGEKVGESLAETAAAIIPLLANKVADIDFGELFSAVESEATEEVPAFQNALKDMNAL